MFTKSFILSIIKIYRPTEHLSTSKILTKYTQLRTVAYKIGQKVDSIYSLHFASWTFQLRLHVYLTVKCKKVQKLAPFQPSCCI